LSASTFQNITTAITFRLYAWGADRGTRTFSINDFTFNGTVSDVTVTSPSNPVNLTICQGGSGNISITAPTVNSSRVVTFNINSEPTETNAAPGNTIANATISNFPTGTTVTGANLLVNNLTATGNSWMSDVRLGLSGALQYNAVAGSTVQSAGAFSFFSTVNTGITVSTSSTTLNLLYWDYYSDNGGTECTFGVPKNAILSLNYSHPATIKWYSAATGGILLGTGASFNPVGTSVLANTNTAGTYNFYAASVNDNGCESSRVLVTVTVNALPTAPVSGNTSFCTGGNTVLTSNATAGSGTISSYQWKVGGVNVASAGTSATYTASAAGSYTVTVTNSNGCSFTSSAYVVSVNALPTVTATANQTICAGSSVTLSGSGATSYSWNNGISNGVAFTPSATTTYTVTGTDSNGCTNTVSSTVTIRPVFTSGTISSTGQTICSGGTPTVIGSTTAASGGDTTITYSWRSSADEYVNVIAGANAATYTPTGVTTTTTFVRYAKDGTCNTTPVASNNTWTVTVNAIPNAPTGTNGASVSTTCDVSTSAVVTISANAGAGNTVLWYAAQSGGGSIHTGNDFSPVVSANTIFYAESVSNGCASLTRTAVQATLTKTNTYTDASNDHQWFTEANWSCGSVPDETTNAVIESGKTVTIEYIPSVGAAKAYSVTLGSGSSTNLTITTGHALIVTDKITVAAGANFVVENDAALKQINDVANVGSIKVNQSTRPIKRLDGVLWSSPVAGQLVNGLASGMSTNYNKYYSVANNTWNVIQDQANATFPEGVAYLMRTPLDFSLDNSAPWNVTFTGVPNNGEVTVNGIPTTDGTIKQYFLVGNPYPSPIDLDAFLAANENISGVFAFYRKRNGASNSAYAYLTKNPGGNDDFQPNIGNGVDENSEGVINPGDVIAVGQGFFVEMKKGVSGVVTFNNGMRIVNNHGAFNRVQTDTSNKYKLKLTSSSNVSNYSQMTLNYYEGSTLNFDYGYDAQSFNDGTTNLSSMLASKPYSIQSRGSYAAADVVPLYFKTNVNGEHRISLSDTNGVFAADQMVIIKDNLTGVQHNLTANGDYVFTATAGTFTNRFEVVYQQAYYTALQANSCGATIANMNSLVYADLVNGATGYRFKVVNNTTSAVQTIDRPQHWFAFNMLSAYDYNTPYTISVQVQKDGVWTGYYGATCTVNSPNIAATGVMQINPSQCGATLATCHYACSGCYWIQIQNHQYYGQCFRYQHGTRNHPQQPLVYTRHVVALQLRLIVYGRSSRENYWSVYSLRKCVYGILSIGANFG
jgi:hypothetical protein